MRTRYAWLIVGLLACTKAGPKQEPDPMPAEPKLSPPPGAKMPPAPPASSSDVTISMTAATLADDCGGVSPPPAAGVSQEQVQRSQRPSSGAAVSAGSAYNACEQTSMQLSVVMTAGGAATLLTVKKVELFDDKGVLIGELRTGTPTVWSADGAYKPWDQKVAPGETLSVSYALSAPPWGKVNGRWDRTYVLKAVITVGGGERSVQRDVHVAAPTVLPPNAST